MVSQLSHDGHMTPEGLHIPKTMRDHSDDSSGPHPGAMRGNSYEWSGMVGVDQVGLWSLEK